jgi:two-component system phosphate regulon sensor histidine kinase PhoR
MVLADKSRITEALNNLIVNSIIYGNRGGKTSVGIDELGENILVEVADDGIGIEEEEIPRIFERFYRTDKSRSRDRGGTGLGLSIVKHIIEAHNQTISVRSEVGVGSSFSFTLKKA